MRHVALAKGRQPIRHLNYTRTFRYGHVDVVGALARMARLTDSRWRTEESATGLGTLPELVEQLLEMRLVESGVHVEWAPYRKKIIISYIIIMYSILS